MWIHNGVRFPWRFARESWKAATPKSAPVECLLAANMNHAAFQFELRSARHQIDLLICLFSFPPVVCIALIESLRLLSSRPVCHCSLRRQLYILKRHNSSSLPHLLHSSLLYILLSILHLLFLGPLFIINRRHCFLALAFFITSPLTFSPVPIFSVFLWFMINDHLFWCFLSYGWAKGKRGGRLAGIDVKMEAPPLALTRCIASLLVIHRLDAIIHLARPVQSHWLSSLNCLPVFAVLISGTARIQMNLFLACRTQLQFLSQTLQVADCIWIVSFTVLPVFTATYQLRLTQIY